MKFSLSKEDILQPLSLLNTISTVKNPTFPILSNVLIIIENDKDSKLRLNSIQTIVEDEIFMAMSPEMFSKT